MLYSIPCKLLIVVSKLAQHRHPLCIKQRETIFISIKKYAYAHFFFLKHLVCSIGLSVPPLLSHPSQKKERSGYKKFFPVYHQTKSNARGVQSKAWQQGMQVLVGGDGVVGLWRESWESWRALRLTGQLGALPLHSAATQQCGPCAIMAFDLSREAGNLEFCIKSPNS